MVVGRSDSELLGLLSSLLARSHENEWLEFKEAKTNFGFDDLGKYFSALSNEARLKNQPCGWLIFGVRDDQTVCGTSYRPDPSKLNSLKQEIAGQTGNITFEEIYEVKHPDGRVLMFRIPPALVGVPTSWKGHYYGRNGESLVALSLNKIDVIRSFHTVPQIDANEVIGEWTTNQWNISETRKYLQPGGGYIESASMLIRSEDSEWGNDTLRQSLATLRPLERNLITSSSTEVSLRRGVDNLGWRLPPEDWSINQSGMIYTSGLLREDFERPYGTSTTPPLPSKLLWFKLTVNRIAGELLRRCKLYRLLGVAEDEPWLFFIRHYGLKDRTLFASMSESPWLSSLQPLGQHNDHNWQGELTQNQVLEEMVGLTFVISSSLFEQFGYTGLLEEMVARVLPDDASHLRSTLGIA